jgi:hypothetical protein
MRSAPTHRTAAVAVLAPYMDTELDDTDIAPVAVVSAVIGIPSFRNRPVNLSAGSGPLTLRGELLSLARVMGPPSCHDLGTTLGPPPAGLW